jgi:hypothetical protein
MRKSDYRRMPVVLAVLVLGLAVGALGQSAATLLEDAIYAEETEGDLDKALRLYDQVIALGGGDDVYRARALYRKGMCHLKAGREDLAEEALGRLLTEFADQEQVISRAREVMAGIRVLDPALMMPPDMLAYAEIGSPGIQIEMLLAMLRGTPLENPLEMMMAGHLDETEGMPMNSAPVVLARLLNPSMVSEFKKIQGLAVGVQGIGQPPQFLAVLYPGQSDALKGILQALIGTVMKPAGEVAGLTLYRAENPFAAAVGEHVMLMSPSMDLLRFAASQYQNHHPAASLADSTEFFTRVPNATRRRQLLTAWVDADGIYEHVTRQMGDQVPPQILALNAIGGLGDVQELHAIGSLQPEGLQIRVEAQLAENHRSLVYDLVRTPSWAGGAPQGIPAAAAAVLCLRIGDGGAAAALQEPLRRLTGLDVGRELFANLDQVALSIVPPTPGQTLNPMLGPTQIAALSLTSRKPEQTRALLHKLLSPVDQVVTGGREPAAAFPAGPEPVAYTVGRHWGTVGGPRGQPLEVLVGTRGNATILSMNPALLDASAPMGAPTALQALPPATSKALMVNLGGLLRMRLAMSQLDQNFPAVAQTVTELIDILEKSNLLLHTEEEDNRLAVQLDVGPIPDLSRVFPLIMQIRGEPIGGGGHALNPTATFDRDTGSATLQWNPRPQAANHVVLFGPSRDQLEQIAELSRPAAQTTVENLEPDRTYYWQIIEKWDESTFVPGEILSFETAGLMAHYTFDNKDAIGHDSSQHGNHGTPHGAARLLAESHGRIGVLACDGASAFVEIPRSVAEDFTIALWVRTTHPGNPGNDPSNPGNDWWQGRGLVDGELAGTFNDFGTSVMDGKFVFGTGEPGPAFESETSVWSASRIDDGNWHHLAAVREANTGKQTVYVDGREEGAVTGSTGPKADPQRLRIGAIQTGEPDQFFEGELDDVRLYNYSLTPEEIRTLAEPTAAAN